MCFQEKDGNLRSDIHFRAQNVNLHKVETAAQMLYGLARQFEWEMEKIQPGNLAPKYGKAPMSIGESC